MEIPKHIVWYADTAKLDWGNPWVRRWYMREILIHGRMADVLTLDWNEIKADLDGLDLPRPIDNLWRDYFATEKSPPGLA